MSHPVILVVEDDPAMQRALSRMLSKYATVLTAATEEEALAHVEFEPKIDGVVLDGHLASDMSQNTVGLLKKLREELGDSVPIIAFSGNINDLLVANGATAAASKSDPMELFRLLGLTQ